ncbi:UDP-2,3-diacylglucosamine diphosphatase [Nitrogeniibacter mangrovi]|uniref:UDP-2,3-diacylglucosamine hydrolase n=1 Tax=Nitrogeniibacter mangrovi TaxID=2016596 RepID=A0A6C1B644_9RHOO|nr:UDP-2,3-diacylglucosamine diphosphatase [Nitrogeniibacter mangrovi]QID18178.1 UDP-2,3-diacylglucosamine diphosphatase [Nitrogeniibacter mangrovi]
MAISDLFIADLHLCSETPDTVRAFFAFLDGPAREARRLFILGDLFEYWAGDDDLDSPFNVQVCERLRHLTEGGIETFFIAGNRDFLIGPAFAERTGIHLIDEPFPIDVGGRKAILMHGDVLCTDDVAYQAFRAQVRQPAWKAAFLAKPLAERKALIAHMRERSEASKQATALEIMDVNGDAVTETFRANTCDLIIHGHTHRPATHRQEIDGKVCERWVLADWHGNAPCLVVEDDRLRRRDFAPG